MHDVPATLSVLGCIWVFAVLLMIGWLPRIVNYLVKYSRLRSYVTGQSKGTRSQISARQIDRFAIAAWLNPSDAERRLPEPGTVAQDSEIRRTMMELCPRHRLAAAAFLVCVVGLVFATATFF